MDSGAKFGAAYGVYSGPAPPSLTPLYNDTPHYLELRSKLREPDLSLSDPRKVGPLT